MKPEPRILLPLALALAVACATVSDQDRASARLRYDIGIAAMSGGELREALRELLTAVELDPELAQAHNALGLIYHALGRMEDSLAHYRRAVALAPKLSEAHNNYGAALVEVGRYDEAIAAFETAMADILYPTPAMAEGNLGWAYYRKGDVERAVRHLRNAVTVSPKFCRGYSWLAEIELSRGKPEQAVAYCRRFEKHCLEDAAVGATLPPAFVARMQLMRGQGLLALGEVAQARESFADCARGADEEVATRCARALAELE